MARLITISLLFLSQCTIGCSSRVAVKRPGSGADTSACKCDGPSDARLEHLTAEDFFADTSLLALCQAIAAGDCERVDRCLRDGVDLTITGKLGMTPLMWAFLFGYYDVVEQLAAEGAPVDLRLTGDLVGKRTTTYYKGDSILFFYVRYTPQRERLLKLLSYSSDKNQRDAFGATVLHYYLAISPFNPLGMNLEGLKTQTDAFTSAGINLDLKTSDGTTPLEIALKTNPLQAVALLQAGADPGMVKTGCMAD